MIEQALVGIGVAIWIIAIIVLLTYDNATSTGWIIWFLVPMFTVGAACVFAGGMMWLPSRITGIPKDDTGSLGDSIGSRSRVNPEISGYINKDAMGISPFAAAIDRNLP